jgi:hypothetical protein
VRKIAEFARGSWDGLTIGSRRSDPPWLFAIVVVFIDVLMEDSLAGRRWQWAAVYTCFLAAYLWRGLRDIGRRRWLTIPYALLSLSPNLIAR